MDRTELDFLRERIVMENRLAAQARTGEAALRHNQLARLYETRLEQEAARLVDEAVVRECSAGDPAIDAVLRILL